MYRFVECVSPSSSEQVGDGGDSDIDLADLPDSDNEEDDEYDQLPPFKPLKKSQPPLAIPLPNMALQSSFDNDNPTYRFQFLEPTSQFHARPVLDTHGWDHDCGYDGVNVEQTLAIVNCFLESVSLFHIKFYLTGMLDQIFF
ncbi:hypothetical protein L2E82_12538 [Cichorium intybus]|uniref:Uncharacterized protein n=1 Tax=Cichorium intybus TaxID=13427 RepID=A0ACB9GGD7_CICIN|nr:hypothetical protein L2E82_12538 [Cichorium intybus]